MGLDARIARLERRAGGRVDAFEAWAAGISTPDLERILTGIRNLTAGKPVAPDLESLIEQAVARL